MESSVEQLRVLLRSLPSRIVPDESVSAVESLLCDVWNAIDGSSDHGMAATKILGRTENLVWDDPILKFAIERHGGTVLGSSRADLQKWSIHIDQMEATCKLGSYRQLTARAARLNVKPLAESIARAIISEKEDACLRWREPSSLVQVLTSKIIPGASKGQTTAGRRTRFRNALEPILAQAGWFPATGRASNTYERKKR